MMDTKMQALEKAQEVQRNNVNNRCSVNDYNNPTRFEVIKGGNVIGVFEYSEPKPLEKDTLCLCGDGIMRYAIGECNKDGINKFYVQGFCSKNVGRGYSHLIFKDFEIIETPGELERVQTGIGMCLSKRCVYFDPHNTKCMAENPNECTVLVGKPSKLKSEKR